MMVGIVQFYFAVSEGKYYYVGLINITSQQHKGVEEADAEGVQRGLLWVPWK